ncbi:MAG TPA: GNAT family N-acetyltransferase [Anaerolineales bacterium]|nr:GNAT family N-acetyltransferase [Anaerolineales bacterium]
MAEITYGFSIEGVNWAELKADLKADDFDNGRTPEQYRLSAENSYLNCFARIDGKIIGNLRVLSDKVGNAYVVDVWTLSAYRKRGIATRMMELAMEKLDGQHVYLFTDDAVEFYKKSGFAEQGIGLYKIVGQYLVNDTR